MKKLFEANKADVYKRLVAIQILRNQCYERTKKGGVGAACSVDGKAFDQDENDKRRDSQYEIWGEADYYIPLSAAWGSPPALFRKYDMNAWGTVLLFKAGNPAYIWLKKQGIRLPGAPPSGGEGLVQEGYKKAFKDNMGFKTIITEQSVPQQTPQ